MNIFSPLEVILITHIQFQHHLLNKKEKSHPPTTQQRHLLDHIEGLTLSNPAALQYITLIPLWKIVKLVRISVS